MKISNITHLSDCIFFNAEFNGESIELAITSSELESEMLRRYSGSSFISEYSFNDFGTENFTEFEKYDIESDYAEVFKFELTDKEKSEVLNCVLDSYREFGFQTKLDFILESMNDAISFKRASIKTKQITNEILSTINKIIK
jgi:hypothetical protein